MITITTRLTRPSLDVEFFQPSEEYKKYFREQYSSSGKILSSKKLEDTGLMISSEIVWADERYLKEFMTDNFCLEHFILPRQQHNFKNKIKAENSFNGSDYSVLEKEWKTFDIKQVYADITIPDDWASLEDFVEWYMSSKMPLFIPWNAEVVRSDDACAVCVFRKGNYQVEFYLEYPKMFIRKHAHPRMEVITMDLGGGGMWPAASSGTSFNWGRATTKLKPGDFHGGDASTILSNGFITLAFQRWEKPEEMTSAAVQWKGELQGPVQAELIKGKKPLAQVDDNFADTTNDTSVNND